MFVVGVPRSGTTLVQSLLAAHSEFTSFTESHLFSRHFRTVPFRPWALLTADPRPRLRQWLDENDLANVLDEAHYDLPYLGPGLLRSLRSRSVALCLLALFDEAARQRGARVWVEKTPRHLLYVRWLEHLGAAQEPEVRTDFVHVLRPGLETVASLYTASRGWERPYDLQTCAKRWNHDLRRSQARCGSARDHFVFYEDLVADPSATMEDLLEALEVAWEPEILQRYREASRSLVTTNEPWKQQVDRPITQEVSTSPGLSAAERKRVLALLRDDLYRDLRRRLGRPENVDARD
jgi:hypothetical protein